MRRVLGSVASVAVALGLGGCVLGGGPSDGDVEAVAEALAALEPEWTVRDVDNTSSQSEGFAHELSIGLDHVGPVTGDALRNVLAVIAEALPHTYRWDIMIVVNSAGAEDYPNMTAAAVDAGLSRDSISHLSDSIVEGTVAEFAEALENG